MIPALIMLLAVIHMVGASHFYNFAWLPQSEGELISDGIFMLLMALAFIAMRLEELLRKKG